MNDVATQEAQAAAEARAAGSAAAWSWRSRPGQVRSQVLRRRWREAERRVLAGLSDERRSRLAPSARLLHSVLRDSRSGVTGVPAPRAVETASGPVPRAFMVASAFVRHSGGSFAPHRLIAFVHGVQEKGALDMNEVWALKPMLQLALLEALADALPGDDPGPVATALDALRVLGDSQWRAVFEAVSMVEQVLARDPSGQYALMDDDSRDLYRRRVGELALGTSTDEVRIAELAITLAEAARRRQVTDPRVHARRMHVGYYLVARGATELKHRIGYSVPWGSLLEAAVLAWPRAFYMFGAALLGAAIVTLFLVGPDWTETVGMALLLAPLAIQTAVELVNQCVSAIVRPQPLPKLDFAGGIPDDAATMVAVPTLLLDEMQVRQLVADLEVRFLANRDRNLYFALLTDLPDSDAATDERDVLATLCADLIDELNAKHGEAGGGFYLFHRHRMYNPGERTWMGWERKRGKLLDLNRLLRNDGFDSFPVKRGNLSRLAGIMYVITLDSDTKLPRGAAHRLVGAMAHPLNRAVVDSIRNIVVDGYGILQPRVGVSIQSALRSRLASIYSGQTGFDIYTRAVSDVYQDLFQEGIFAGKGIYEVDVLRAVLDDRFPTNALLSHDLIEGAYARTALVSDVEIIDDYPSHYSAYNRRKHRWVRGDWQAARWLLPRVPDAHGVSIPNPISLLSRWKIHDNLRRSMMEPTTLALLIGGWIGLPGGGIAWTAITVGLLLLPAWTRPLLDLLRVRKWSQLGPTLQGSLDGFAKANASVLLYLVFLPHQALVLIDAVVRTFVRSIITKRKLLEWETAAQAELDAPRRTPVDAYLDWSPVLVIAVFAAVLIIRPASLAVAAPMLVLWVFARSIAGWLNAPSVATVPAIDTTDRAFLRGIALRTWRYFDEFAQADDQWLIPDNVQAAPQRVAHRTSPTNIGLLLNTRLAALEFGYLTVLEFIIATERTLDTIGRMKKAHGHLLNWYDTRTLEPLAPEVVSTVDSGNFAASLWTLATAARELRAKPIFSPALWQGLWDEIVAAGAPAAELRQRVAAFGGDTSRWLAEIGELERTARREGLEPVARRCAAIGELATLFASGDVPARSVTLLAPASRDGTAHDAAAMLVARLDAIARTSEQLVEQMDYAILYDERRRLLSIGLDAAGQRDPSCYDLLASEARMAAFIAIAKNDVPLESWFQMGRGLTLAHGARVLLSWSGTMFEYLMPTLWMQTYPETLLEQSAIGVVAVQQAAGRERDVPWGVSEAAYAVTDDDGTYQYYAFGLPELRIKVEPAERHVVAPYASMLALPIAPVAAIANLRRMADLAWIGTYGFYESADYHTAALGGVELVRCWMAHHVGMSLLAICNTLHDAPFHRWFHGTHIVKATELVLQERVPITTRIERTPSAIAPVASPDGAATDATGAADTTASNDQRQPAFEPSLS